MSRLQDWQEVKQAWDVVGVKLDEARQGGAAELRAMQEATESCRRLLTPMVYRIGEANKEDPALDWPQTNLIARVLNRFLDKPPREGLDKWIDGLSIQFGHGNRAIGTAINQAIADEKQR